MIRKIIPGLVVLSLGLLACGVQISLPSVQKVGPTTTDQIALPLPADLSQTVHLTLTFGAGILKIHSGSDALVTGTATYNIPDFKPAVTSSGGDVRIEQGNWHLNGLPDLSNIKNEWDLSLGKVPLDLTISGGAYNATYQFGGLALTNLTIKDGAAQSKLDFSSPNTTEMALLSYETGVSNISLTGLANANFDSLDFNSGAGNYTLDFSGSLHRDASVNIRTGASNMTLIIPTGLASQVTVNGGLSNVAHDSSWTQSNNVYIQQGSGMHLVIVVDIGAGNLTLTH